MFASSCAPNPASCAQVNGALLRLRFPAMDFESCVECGVINTGKMRQRLQEAGAPGYKDYTEDDLKDILASCAIRIVGTPPLHHAARSGNGRLVARMLSRGADANLRNGLGNTPLHCAVESVGPERNDIIRLLMAHGADAFCSNGTFSPIDALIAGNSAAADMAMWMAAQPPPAERPRALLRRDAAPAVSSKTTDSDFTESEGDDDMPALL